MLHTRAERLERAFWLWRLRLSRVAALLPTTLLTGAGALGVLLADRLAGGALPTRAPHAVPRAEVPAAPRRVASA